MAKMKTIYKHLLITFLFLGNVCFLQAQTTGDFTTLKNLITGTAANGTLTLTMDYVAAEDESRLEISKNITIDLNGHIVNRNLTESKANGNVFYVNNATLTIIDSNPTASHSPAVTYTNPISQEKVAINGGIIMGGYIKGNGGGIEVSRSGRLVMSGGTIAKNKTDKQDNTGGMGGGVYNAGNFTMTGGRIAGNASILYGGGVWNNSNARFLMRNSEISGNEADSKSKSQTEGGGIYNAGHLEIDHCTISGNRAWSSTEPGTNTNGGGIRGTRLGNDSLVMVITHSEISGNYARYYGGGVYVGGNNKTRIELVGNTIQENEVYTAGGGLAFQNQGTSRLTMKDNLFVGNEAYTNGGGIFIDGGNKGMTIEIDNNKIKNNKANYGGGIRLSNTTLEMHSDSIVGNIANNSGGGVYNHSNSSFTMKGGTITDNTANQYGGGVYNGHTFILENGTISNNKTTASTTSSHFGGGGIYNGKNFTCTGGTISNNASNAHGGGVENYLGSAVIRNATIESNTAKAYGGGVFNNTSDTLLLVDALITNNTATSWGGGIYNINGLLTITNTIITENAALSGGGVYYTTGTNATMNASTVSKNRADIGGGIYGYTNVSGTTGRSISFTMNGGIVTENTAGTNGGGVFFGRNVDYESTFTMNDAIVTENTAGTNGGGVYCDKGTLVMHSSTIVNNEAKDGGGIYNNGDSHNAIVTMEDDSNKIQDNHASSSGGGVYNNGDRAIFTLLKGQIIGNTATSGQGIYQNGIFNLSGTPVLDPDNDIYLHSTKRKDDNSGVNRVITKVGAIDRPEGYFHVVLGNSNANLYHGRNIVESSDGVDVLESDLSLFTFDNQAAYNRKILFERYWPNDNGTNRPVIELFSPTWVGIVTEQPAGFSLNNIDSKEDLAWLISYVNGYNGQTPNPDATVVLTADVDMGEYEWVPIGTGARPFGGTFNGQGNTISNLRNTTEYVNPGMFGKVSGTVKNTFVASSSFVTRPDEEGYYGIIADTLTSSGKVVYSEACGALTASASNAHIGGIVGLLSGTNSTMHSCTSIADLTGYEMGGLACRNEGSVANSLSYPKFTYSMLTGDFVGGLVADNSGSVSNCYLRRDRGNSVSGASYDPLVANGTAATDSYKPSDYSGTQRLNDKYKYGQHDQMVGDQCLLDKLNGKVVGDLAPWTRTMASTINNDYPVLALPDFSCIAQIDTVNNLFMEYKADLNTMIRKYNATTEGTNVCLYGANGSAIDTDNSDQVKVYVCENVGLLQAEGNRLNATVGVTFDNSDASDLGGKPYDWHMFATPLKDASMGISYSDNSVHGYMQEPTAITLQANGYFPTDSPYGSMDFYCYSEQYYHWINFKRNSADHWHQDGAHDNIPYTNETTMVPAKGYMMAIDKQTTLMNKGILTNGGFTYPLSYTELSGDEAPLRGCNLIGNPYQSYLDFDELANDDVDTYYILDADHRGYIAYTKGATGSENAAPRYIHPHQGFFVRATANGQSVTFTNAMRQATGKPESYFRDDEIRYPLVNLVCTDANGKRDYATVEFDRPESGGGEKVKGLRSGNASIGIHLANKNYQIAFAPSGIQTVPVHFKAYENGNYTLSWSTENADFGYLHLIDNLTGIDLDCLQTGEYRFAASETDYLSRFKLVFQYTGMDEHETEPESFAFLFGDEIVVNGEGRVELFDLNGRRIMAETVSGPQSSIGKPNVASGMYLLRLTDNKRTHVQKLIIR